MADAPESPVERVLPAVALGVAALLLLLLTAGGGRESQAAAIVHGEPASTAAPYDAATGESVPDAAHGVEAVDAGVPLDLLPPTEEEARIKAIALQAILERPEIVMQAVEILRQREAEAGAAATAAALTSVGPDLATAADAGVIGNPDGSVTVVEFFDYNCGYCRRAVDAVDQLVADDTDVRVVLREFPILSEGSVEAARVALAARMQDEAAYGLLHGELLRMSGQANAESALAVAGDLGLDVEKLRADMENPEIEAHIAASRDFAQRLGIQGTPAFVIGEELIPGAVPLEDLQAAVDAARES